MVGKEGFVTHSFKHVHAWHNATGIKKSLHGIGLFSIVPH